MGSEGSVGLAGTSNCKECSDSLSRPLTLGTTGFWPEKLQGFLT